MSLVFCESTVSTSSSIAGRRRCSGSPNCRWSRSRMAGKRLMGTLHVGMAPLTDTLARPVRDLRISVTDRCNFRCTYCMPREVFGHDFVFLRREQLLTFEEIERLARLFLAAGVTKIRLTGGEPLLRRNLEALVSMLSALRPPGLADLTL